MTDDEESRLGARCDSSLRHESRREVRDDIPLHGPSRGGRGALGRGSSNEIVVCLVAGVSLFSLSAGGHVSERLLVIPCEGYAALRCPGVSRLFDSLRVTDLRSVTTLAS